MRKASLAAWLVWGTGVGAAEAPRWPPGAAIPVWIEATPLPPAQLEMVRRALRTWERAGSGRLRLAEVPELPSRGIRVRFATGDNVFGEAVPHVDRETGRIVRVDVVLSVDTPGDTVHRQLVLYLTALHELGHALGLEHTDRFASIMYRFRRPEDPERYFGGYRRLLRDVEDIGTERASGLAPEDREALRALYDR